MARYLNTSKLQLHCGDCDVIFRHEESDRAEIVFKDDNADVEKSLWDSPCCHRRYSLISNTDSEISGVITHGYRDRKSRDKYQVLDSKGIGWAWDKDNWVGVSQRQWPD